MNVWKGFLEFIVIQKIASYKRDKTVINTFPAVVNTFCMLNLRKLFLLECTLLFKSLWLVRLKNNNILIQKRCIKWIKSNSKDFYIVAKKVYFK